MNDRICQKSPSEKQRAMVIEYCWMEVEKPALEHVATDMHHPSLGNHRLTADQTAVRAFLTTLASMKDWDQSPSDQRMAVISQQQHCAIPSTTN